MQTLVCVSLERLSRVVGNLPQHVKRIIVLSPDLGWEELKGRFSQTVDIYSYKEFLVSTCFENISNLSFHLSC